MEKIKTAAIIVLLALMIGLFAVNMLLAVPELGRMRLFSPAESENDDSISPASLPFLTAISKENGVEVSGVGRDLYEKVSPVIFEALLTMDEPVPFTGELLPVLRGNCVYMRYGCAIELDLLSAWAGGEGGRSLKAAALAAAENGGQVVLLIETDSGEIYSANTGASLIRLSQTCASSESNGFWPEDGSFWPVFDGAQQADVLTVSQAISGELPRKLAEAFGLNPNRVSYYKDSASNQVYVDRQSTLTLTPEGEIIYSSEEGISFSGASFARRVEACRKLVSSVWEMSSAYGTPSFCTEKDGSFYFELDADGIFVSGSWCAVVRVENGRITAASMLPLSCQKSGETVSMLPGAQAAAAAGGEAPVRILYFLDQGRLTPALCVDGEARNAVE